MSIREIKNMLSEARRFGIGAYNAWTTEPLLRPDLPEIMRYAHDLGLITSLVTNGLLLEKRAKDLYDLDYISVSLDGLNSYREIRGADVNVVIRGIEAARREGHEVLINCVISALNLDELGDLVELAKDLDVWISFEPINELKDIDRAVWDEMGISDMSKYQMALDRLIELKSNGAPIINSQTYLNMIRSLTPQFNCHASDIILHVAADGTIYNCRLQNQPFGNVSDGLGSVWDSSKDLRMKLKRECEGCLFFGYVENSLLYEFNREVMAHYEWM